MRSFVRMLNIIYRFFVEGKNNEIVLTIEFLFVFYSTILIAW